MHFWMFYAILSAQKKFHPKFFWVKQGATQCYQAFLVCHYRGVHPENQQHLRQLKPDWGAQPELQTCHLVKAPRIHSDHPRTQ